MIATLLFASLFVIAQAELDEMIGPPPELEVADSCQDDALCARDLCWRGSLEAMADCTAYFESWGSPDPMVECAQVPLVFATLETVCACIAPSDYAAGDRSASESAPTTFNITGDPLGNDAMRR